MPEQEEPSLSCQIVLVGVGGQGILFATRLLETCAIVRGLPLIGSETHGMSQRGGSVSAHVKLGAFAGPLVARGAADLVLGFERAEALMGLSYVRPGGTCLANFTSATPLPPAVAEAACACDIEIVAVDACAEAARLGVSRSENLVVLGALAAHPAGPFSLDELLAASEAISPPPFREANATALKAGAQLGAAALAPTA